MLVSQVDFPKPPLPPLAQVNAAGIPGVSHLPAIFGPSGPEFLSVLEADGIRNRWSWVQIAIQKVTIFRRLRRAKPENAIVIFYLFRNIPQ